ncbi:hypothetical protein AB0392_03145 [Nonomuraea angiospora]|uniref:hypothetical protein n=1 Tax=Nonomuraea angiospora TaxID=46172 RepID=UPI00344EDAE5
MGLPHSPVRYGKPFMMAEWNSDPNKGLTHRASYIQAQLAEFRAHRSTEAFQSAMFYELDGGTQWGLTESDGTPLDPPYTAYRSFVSAHPDT